MRPLIVRLRNYVGDVVLSLPALELLQSNGYAPHLVGKPWVGQLLEAYGWPTTPRAGAFLDRVRQLRELPRESREREAQQRLTFAAPPRPPTSSRAAQTPGWLATR